MNEFENFLKQKNKDTQSEIFSVNFKNQKYWIKKARENKIKLYHKILFKIFPFAIFAHGEEKTALQALNFETSKIKKLHDLGLNVPRIVYQNDEIFVLEDSGENLHEIFKNGNLNDEDFLNLAKKGVETLAKLHNLGFYHGGSQTRNFTYKNDQIYLLDFEESFDSKLDLNNLKFRDFLLYLLSFTKYKNRKIPFMEITNYYSDLTDKSAKIKLKNTAKKLDFLCKILKKFKKSLGSDLQNVLILLDEINKDNNEI